MIAHGSDGSSERKLIDAALRDVAVDSTAVGSSNVSTSSSPRIDTLPGYQIFGEIHRGGQGCVFQALQESTGRDVAIKVMRDGPFSGSGSQARFEREVRILAALSHPNIVTVHESSSVDGFHYFVMNYVSGRDVVSFVREQAIDERETIKLIGQVCRAVSAAHQIGVIHRDLKPSNILVSDDGVPFILDFGLAKVDDNSVGSSLQTMTQTGQFVGTLPWASPEQVGGSADTIDVRSDVYALGVVWYQALTGQFPYGVVGPAKYVITNIVEKSPELPRSACPSVSEDAQTIVLKCLEKDPERRYQSAAALSEDIDRYLNGQPILARRSSASYHLRKWVGRHKLVASMAMAMILGTVVFTVCMTVMYGLAEDARRAERNLRIEAEDNLARAIEAESAARVSAATSDRVSDFLVGMFEVSDPAISSGVDLTARELLRRGTMRIDNILRDEPEVGATLKHTIAKVYFSLGAYDDALSMYESALETREQTHGRRHESVLETLNSMAEVYYRKNEFAEAERLCHEVISVGQHFNGSEHISVANAMDTMGALLASADAPQAEARFHAALNMRRRLLGNDHPDVAKSLNHLAIFHANDRDRRAECSEYLDEAIAIYRKNYGQVHPEISHCLSTRAKLLYSMGKKSEAEAHLREALDISKAVYGDAHPNNAFLYNALAVVLMDMKRLEEAEQCYMNALAMERKLVSEDHKGVGIILVNLGKLCRDMDRHPESIAYYRESLDIWDSAENVNPIRLNMARGYLGAAYLETGDLDRAEPLLRLAHEKLTALLGSEHPRVAEVSKSIAILEESEQSELANSAGQ